MFVLQHPICRLFFLSKRMKLSPDAQFLGKVTACFLNAYWFTATNSALLRLTLRTSSYKAHQFQEK